MRGHRVNTFFSPLQKKKPKLEPELLNNFLPLLRLEIKLSTVIFLLLLLYVENSLRNEKK